jgi:signal transduction histidine kinase
MRGASCRKGLSLTFMSDSAAQAYGVTLLIASQVRARSFARRPNHGRRSRFDKNADGRVEALKRKATPMMAATRNTGIEPLGDMPWGTHVCLFYETKQDALDTLIPYFKAGLESRERCVWAVSDPIAEEEARAELMKSIPNAGPNLTDGAIEILPGEEWYMGGAGQGMESIVSGWHEKLARAIAAGYEGLRISGNAFWLQRGQWAAFAEYEHMLDRSLTGKPMIVLCTYPLDQSHAAEVLDVARAHEFTLARRHGRWERIETPELKQAKREIHRLKTELEGRVVERTRQLAAANERLEAEYAERERVEGVLEEAKVALYRKSRLTAMGVLTASIAHEINQPLTGIVTNSEASLRWLSNDEPDLERVKAGLTRIARDANRAADVITRIRALVAGRSEYAEIDINQAVTEAAAFMKATLQRYRVGVRLVLAADTPPVMGDKVQLQQAIINLVSNAAEAMADVGAHREIIVGTGSTAEGGVMVTIEDHGGGLSPEASDRMFEPFFTTKSQGMGLGLSIARTIVEAHGGSLSASPAAAEGTVFKFTIPGSGP